MPGFFDQLRNLPLTTRRSIAGITVLVLGVITLGIWFVTDFGLSRQDGLGSVREGAGSVADLIQDQTDKFAEDRASLQESLNTVLKSNALVAPEGLVGVDEDPDGILYLGYEYRENNTLTRVEQIEFYPSSAVVVATIANESDQAIDFDASRGSVLVQNLETGAELAYQPLFQVGSPTQLEAGQTTQVIVLFGPVNGRHPFNLVLGDFSTSPDPAESKQWAARFEIDPDKIIKND
jgi:hypothetical protein